MFDSVVTFNNVHCHGSIVIAGLALCIGVRECAKTYMACRLGDSLGKTLQRDTLDPRVHFHPVWTFLLPFMLVFLAAITGSQNVPFVAMGNHAVHNPLQFQRSLWSNRMIKSYDARWWIAVSGPIANALFALLCWGFAALLIWMQWYRLYTYSLADAFMHLAYLNVTLALFNLLPIFPLDGASIWPRLMPRRTYLRFLTVRPLISQSVAIALILGAGSAIALLSRRITYHMLLMLT